MSLYRAVKSAEAYARGDEGSGAKHLPGDAFEMSSDEEDEGSKLGLAGSKEGDVVQAGTVNPERHGGVTSQSQQFVDQVKAVAGGKQDGKVRRDAVAMANMMALRKQRVLMLTSRNVSHRVRHLMKDLHTMLPHAKVEAKIDERRDFSAANEMAEMRSANKIMLLECRRKSDMYMWLAGTPKGPSMRFQITNVHTMSEMKLTGNCLKGSRPIVTFNDAFDARPAYRLMKEMLLQLFNVPHRHPKSKPFVDHVVSFSLVCGAIHFRHYQITKRPDAIKAADAMDLTMKRKTDKALRAEGKTSKKGKKKDGDDEGQGGRVVGKGDRAVEEEEATEFDRLQLEDEERRVLKDMELFEIGPRFVLHPIRMLRGAFRGESVWVNPEYQTPAAQRREQRSKDGHKYKERVMAKVDRTLRKEEQESRPEARFSRARVFEK